MRRLAASRDEAELRRAVVEVGRWMYRKGYIAATDGNISLRLPDGSLLMTPTGTHKGFLHPEDLVRTDLEGNPLRGETSRPSSEMKMHLLAYRERPDIGAVVHAHPPMATAFSIAGLSLALCVIPEVVVTLGSIPTAPYGTPSTYDLPESIRELIRCSDSIILERHGIVAVAGNVAEAFENLEKVEHTARITYYAQTLGKVRTLPEAEVDRLLRIRSELGLGGKNVLEDRPD